MLPLAMRLINNSNILLLCYVNIFNVSIFLQIACNIEMIYLGYLLWGVGNRRQLVFTAYAVLLKSCA